MITLRLPRSAAEHVCFQLSPLAELLHSWHVLAAPAHHALQLPWVRRCRDLPAGLLSDLREWSWVATDYVPALFEPAAGPLVASFADELDRVADLCPDLVAVDLANAVLRDGEPPADPAAADRLARIQTEPVEVLGELLDLIERYWRAAFAAEWRRLEPHLLDSVTQAGQAMPDGVLPLLGRLAPAARVDQRARTIGLDRPHEHRVDVAKHGPLRLTPSCYSWPHVRVTCDDPWPLRLTYPVVPSSPRTRRAGPADLLTGLRAIGAQPRLNILRLLRTQPRSTQELSGLLGLSAAAISRHLRQLLDADLVRTHREGYYVLYQLAPHTLEELAAQLLILG
ncbi:MAG: DUF5937 family protein [Labedaea sp.]